MGQKLTFVLLKGVQEIGTDQGQIVLWQCTEKACLKFKLCYAKLHCRQLLELGLVGTSKEAL